MSEKGLQGAILDAPGDDVPRLVYADWLEEHGHADYARFIRLSCQLAREVMPEGSSTWEPGLYERYVAPGNHKPASDPASPDRRPKRLLRRGTIGKGAALASLGALVVSTQALAAGFMIRENSAIAVGTVYAGNGSRADAPSTVFNNPAGMTRLTDGEVEGGIAVILPSIKFNGSASAGGKPVSGVNDGNAGRAAFVPNLSWVFGIADGLKGGIAVTVPFGNSVAYDWIY